MTKTDTVLLVEDELLVAMEIQDLIEEVGLATEGPYSTVAGANEALGSVQVACAVLDVRLRDGDIFPVADELCARGIPMIFHSGHATPDQITSRYPDAIFFEKPCVPAQIVQTIRQLTGKEQLVA
ncbi:response regulator [Cereibacter sp. SYSU M97828]|nr:response regulator [Cereibacter flavus]